MNMLIVVCAKYLFVVAPLIVALVLARLPRELQRALILRGILALALGVLLAKGGGALVNEPRPFVTQHIAPLFPHEADNGFPSDHTLLTFACAFLILPFSRSAGMAAGVIGWIVGTARVLARVHSPLDIVASILFALLACLIASTVVHAPSRSAPAAPVPL